MNNTPSSEVASGSPCVRNCCLNKDDICLGCGRHLNEILAWRDASCEERQDMLELARKRLEKNRV